MRNSWILLIPMLLGGCLPPAVAIASYAVDGVSYVATGKSLSDHGISGLTGQDCSTWRLLAGRPICIEPDHPEAAAPFENRIAGHPGARRVAAAGEGPYDLVLGSFSDRENARRLARRHARHGARIIAARLGGQDLSRVVIGPLDRTQVAALREQGVQGFVVASTDAPSVVRQARADLRD